MKKLLACLWVLALSMAAFCCAVADEPETFISGDWEYRVLADGTAQIIDYSNYEATSIPIPDTLDDRKVTDVDPLHFNIPKKKCSAFIVSPDHPTLAVIDGVLFSKPDKRLISYPKAKAGSTYAIPQGIEIIGNLAFYNCTSLTSISIPNSVTSIRPEAFYGCSSLTSIPIPNSVTSIGMQAFEECSSLTNIIIPNSVTSIGVWAFADCSALTSLSIPDSVTSIEDWAFIRCPSLTSIFIPNSVTSIGNNPFYGCEKITIELSSDHPVFAVIDGVLFSKPDKRLIFYPHAKEGTSYTIPQGIEIIEDFSFSGTSLTSISIPDSVTSIGNMAFDECPNLTLTVGRNSYAEQYAKENNIPYTVQDTTENNASYALPDDSDDWKYRILADGTAEIDFYPNLEATSIQIPETLNGRKVTNIAGGAFRICLNNSSFEVSPDHSTFAVIDGVLFSKPDKRLISYPKAKEGDTYAIPQGIEVIEEFAFSECTSLTSISIPNSVTSIGEDAFTKCSSLDSISIPDSVTSIGGGVFDSCPLLTNITIPDSVTSIGGWAFASCLSLTSLSIPDSVTSIGDWAFNNCPHLTLTVGRNSYAEQYAKENNIPYAYPDANDWLTK